MAVTENTYDAYQFSIFRNIECWDSVKMWCATNIPRERWAFLDHREFVIGFSYLEDYILCMLTWG